MKVRKGFVSNSSSSSFIIAVPPSEKCLSCGRSDGIADQMRRSLGATYPHTTASCDTEFFAQGDDVVPAYETQLKEWNTQLTEEDKLMLARVQEAIELKFDVFYFEASYHDEAVHHLMKAPGVQILYNSEE